MLSDRPAAPSPLTHHEILRLVEPFTRRDRHVDLAASNRIARRLAFKPIAHDGETAPALAGASELLELENPRPQEFRLIRTLTLAGGATAKLTADGPDAGELLARIESVPLLRPFQFVGAVAIARSYRLEPGAGGEGEGAPPMLALTSAEARLDGLTFTLKAETGPGYPAEIALSPQADVVLDLPDDVLATLGWNWSVLRTRGTGWSGTLRAPRRQPARSRHIERALETAVAHLARTLAEPPRLYHERLARARWTVVFRRMIPLLCSVVLLAGSLALCFVDLPRDSLLLMMTFNFPPVLLCLMFTMRELPRFEIPPPPRPSRAPSWIARRPDAIDAGLA
jgi:hypothetical protein